jgi:predicted metal-dependent hydrolase
VEKIEYTTINSNRAKQIRITIRRNGEIIVTKPHLLPSFLVSRFVQSRADWIRNGVKKFKDNPPPLLSGKSRRDYILNKERARMLVHDRVTFWNKRIGQNIGSIRIGNQKSRWGSCSKKGNLNFNYKLIYLPKEVLDYVIVHELCHLVHLNHSGAFWSLVEEQIPDWKKVRNDLKRY